MKELLVAATEYAVLGIDAIALFVIIVGTLQAFVASLGGLFSALSGHRRREIWLRYARWLIGGLTFQLAADILESAITTDWQSVARLAAIAVIRTFLNYFLEKDLKEAREMQKAGEAGPGDIESATPDKSA
jgi:uncharacterized membrane protein